VSDRDRGLREAITDISEGNERAQGTLLGFREEHTQRIDAVLTSGSEWTSGLEKKAGENKRLRDVSLKSLNAVNNTLRDGFADIQTSTSKSLADYADEFQKHGNAMSVETSSIRTSWTSQEGTA